uniref:Uncharacterized protein n=1 Tax=Equus asinus TaxID=9793 RepID=A0A9L0K7S4_EQUAS
MMRTPRPRQTKCATERTDKIYIINQNTYPLHALQSTFLLSCSFVVLPLYRSSKDTLGEKRMRFNHILPSSLKYKT